MPKPEDKEIEVKPLVDKNQEVVVELDDKDEPIKQPEKKAEEPRYVRLEDLDEKLKKSNAAYFAEQRKIEKSLRDLTEKLGPANKTQQQQNQPADEWDDKVQKDWKGTVRELARIEAQELRKQELEQQRAVNEREQHENLLNNNKKRVIEKHPELNDATSDKAQIFQEIISRNPDYIYNPFGPVLAMRDMEEEMRSQGKMIDESTQKLIDKENARRGRTNATVVPAGNGSAAGNKVILTKEEREFCDHHNIKYEVYARNRKLTATNNGGVEA